MNTNERILAVAFSQIGTTEMVGANHDPQVLKYFAEIGHSWVKDDETPWCAAFANWVCQMAVAEKTGKLNARSFLEIGTEVNIEDAKPGDVVVLWRDTPTSSKGHVAFFTGWNEPKTKVYLFGGNQNNKVGIELFDKVRVLGIRRLSSPMIL